MKKRLKLDESEILDEVLDEITDKSEDFKALVLRLYNQLSNVGEVSKLTKVPKSTIYKWIDDWNKKKDLH
jgi:transposase